jgi:hypothetical protein
VDITHCLWYSDVQNVSQIVSASIFLACISLILKGKWFDADVFYESPKTVKSPFFSAIAITSQVTREELLPKRHVYQINLGQLATYNIIVTNL